VSIREKNQRREAKKGNNEVDFEMGKMAKKRVE